MRQDQNYPINKGLGGYLQAKVGRNVVKSCTTAQYKYSTGCQEQGWSPKAGIPTGKYPGISDLQICQGVQEPGV